jgi:hypothetical protein
LSITYSKKFSPWFGLFGQPRKILLLDHTSYYPVLNQPHLPTKFLIFIKILKLSIPFSKKNCNEYLLSLGNEQSLAFPVLFHFMIWHSVFFWLLWLVCDATTAYLIGFNSYFFAVVGNNPISPNTFT